MQEQQQQRSTPDAKYISRGGKKKGLQKSSIPFEQKKCFDPEKNKSNQRNKQQVLTISNKK